MSRTPEQVDELILDRDEQKITRIKEIRRFRRPYSEEREKLWCEVFLRSLDPPHVDPTSPADWAVLEFDKRFEHRDV